MANQLADAARAVNARIGFVIHLTAFVLVNALLVVVNLLTYTHYLWFIWPLLGWSAGIALHAVLAFCLPRMSGVRRGMIANELRRKSAKRKLKASADGV